MGTLQKLCPEGKYLFKVYKEVSAITSVDVILVPLTYCGHCTKYEEILNGKLHFCAVGREKSICQQSVKLT